MVVVESDDDDDDNDDDVDDEDDEEDEEDEVSGTLVVRVVDGDEVFAGTTVWSEEVNDDDVRTLVLSS